MKKVISIVVIFLVVISVGSIAKGGEKMMEKAHIMLAPAEIKWTEGPASLPPGSKMAVLEGDPKSTGPVTIRLKFPPNYTLAPHTHGGDERVTVISGILYFDIGEKIDEVKVKALPAGSFFLMPQGTAMFGFTKGEETVVQLNVNGPWTVTYMNPADDPRKK